MFENWKTTLSGVITGAALGYAGYTSGDPELIIAGATAFTGGLLAKDAKPKKLTKTSKYKKSKKPSKPRE